MKNKPSTFLKQVFSFVVSMVKSRSMALKSKTSSIKARLLIFNLLRNKKVLMSAINHKIHALVSQEKEDRRRNGDDLSKAIVLYNDPAKEEVPAVEEDEDDYPDLRHTLFDLENGDEDEELVNGTGSVIDLMRNSREGGNQEFILEDEIDHAADVFIRRFHRQMWIQKQDSFKRYSEMLARGV